MQLSLVDPFSLRPICRRIELPSAQTSINQAVLPLDSFSLLPPHPCPADPFRSIRSLEQVSSCGRTWFQSIYNICNLYNVAYDEYLRASISLLLCRLFLDSSISREGEGDRTKAERHREEKRRKIESGRLRDRRALCANV